MKRLVIVLVVTGTLAACHQSATGPDPRSGTGPYTLALECDSGAATALTCMADLSCGLYGCPAGVPTGNVTNLVAWSVDDPTVAALSGKGVLVSVNPGKTTLRALFHQPSMSVTNSQRIGVFAGTPPLPLNILAGVVYDGPTVPEGPLNGALVEITAGLLSGATSKTGLPPVGSGFVSITGQYTFIDAPPGAMTLRVSKPGYVTVVRDVVFPAPNPADLNFQMNRSSTQN